MINTYYTSLTAMLAASYGLQVASNNIANMQRPGFKRDDVLYSSLGNEHESAGIRIDGLKKNYSAGHYLETNNVTDLAIVGQGFFVLRLPNDDLAYTRNGEFYFNNGLLIEKHTQAVVQGYNQQGHLVALKSQGPETIPGSATHIVELAGEFILIEKKEDDFPQPPDPNPIKTKYEPISFTINNIFDKEGHEHQISLTFTPKEAVTHQDFLEGLEWELNQLTDNNTELDFLPQTLQFSAQSNGTAENGNNTINFKLKDGQTICVKFGEYTNDTDKSVRLNKADPTQLTSNVSVYRQNGYGAGTQIELSFDEAGQLIYHYDNGQSIRGLPIALARFENPQEALLETNGTFRTKFHIKPEFGKSNQPGFGTIQAQQLESSNVDSTTEFAQIVMLQRMFQASSQIMELDKQLLEELYK